MEMIRRATRFSRRLAERRMHRPGEGDLSIERLISPLRYDVIVRERYFEFLAQNLDLYHADFGEYMVRAQRHEYFSWFRIIAYLHRFGSPPSEEWHVLRAFADRVRRTTDLYLAFRHDGFDARFPISVRQTTDEAETPSGKVLAPRFYPVDGCHRLALLHMSGRTTLPFDFYRIAPARRSPPDNTHTLLSTMRVTPREYYDFVSRGYTDKSFSEREPLLAHIRDESPELLVEVECLLAADEPLLDREG